MTAAIEVLVEHRLDPMYTVYFDTWLSEVGLNSLVRVDGTWPVGKQVMLSGLLNRPFLNGMTGHCTQFFAAKKRFAVQVEGHGTLLLKPENVQCDAFLIESAALFADWKKDPLGEKTAAGDTGDDHKDGGGEEEMEDVQL